MLIKDIQDNINVAQRNIDNALLKAGRKDKVLIIGATKTQSTNVIEGLSDYNLLSDVGENKTQEIVQKYDYGKNLKWHMIGQLQSNKVKYIIDKVVLIHSLDRLSLAQEIQRQAEKRSMTCDCLIEINMGSEISKGGIEPSYIDGFVEILTQFKNINIRGLMTVMPDCKDTIKLQNLYKDFNQLFKSLQKKWCSTYKNINVLSCGMSNDYEIAIEYGGATMVRLGRTIFGQRS